MIPHRVSNPRTVLLALAIILPVCAYALPEDDIAQIVFENSASFEMSLNEGEIVQRAPAGGTTCATQGSRKICGAEIRVQHNEDDTLKRVTATGTPASFQQQPEVDQAILHFSGRTIVFDQNAQMLTSDGDARFSRGADEWTHEHIEYDLETRTVRLDSGGTDSQGRGTFTPEAAGDAE